MDLEVQFRMTKDSQKKKNVCVPDRRRNHHDTLYSRVHLLSPPSPSNAPLALHEQQSRASSLRPQAAELARKKAQ